MLQSIREWVLNCAEEPVSAVSIDDNPTLDQIFNERWPGLRLERAVPPEHDIQRLVKIPSDGCDLCYSNQVLEHVPKPWLAGEELVRILRPGGLGIHTTCAYNPRHGPPAFNDYYRFLPDGLAELFDGVTVLVKGGWGNREALIHNLTTNDGHGALGGRRFHPLVGQRNEELHPWVTWIIFRKNAGPAGSGRSAPLNPSVQGHTQTVAETYAFDSERKEQALVRSLVEPGMTVLDVGANIGKYTKLFSLLVGQAGRVFAFEPDPGSVQRVRQLVATEALANVTVVNQAVAEKSGAAQLNQFPEEYCSWNSLGRPHMEDPRNRNQFVPIVGSVEIETVTLDEFCQAQGLRQIGYLKLDVEGAELRALQGARGLLARQAIRFLQFEVSQKMLEGLGTRARPVFDLLASYGYECRCISAEGKMTGVVTDSNEFYENYIAVPARLPGVDEAFATALVAALQHPVNRRRVLDIHSRLELPPPDRRYLETGAWFDAVTLLNCLARLLQPANHLEIGRCREISLAQVLVESPSTTVFGFRSPSAGEDLSRTHQALAAMTGSTTPNLARLKLAGRPETPPALGARPGDPEAFDLVFVDEPAVGAARASLEAAFSHLAPGGALILGNLGDAALAALWDESATRHPDYLFINDQSGEGAGVVFRPPFQRLAASLTSASAAGGDFNNRLHDHEHNPIHRNPNPKHRHLRDELLEPR